MIGLAGGAFALLVALGVVLAIVLSGGGTSIEDATRNYMHALVDGDCDELVKHDIVSRDADEVDECEEQIEADNEERQEHDVDLDSYELEIESVEILDEDDDEASVKVEHVISWVRDGDDQKQDAPAYFILKKNDDGDWQVDSYDYDAEEDER